MFIGISMGLEICLIIGQVSLSLLYWKRNLQTDSCGPGRDYKKTAYIQVRSFRPELWKKMGKNAKLKEKQKWSNEMLHLENARKLRGIYFIDPGGQGIQRNHQECPQQVGNISCSCHALKNFEEELREWWILETKLACFLGADESTRMRMGNSIPHHHEDHIAGKGENSLQHYNLVHKFILMPQAMKILAAKAAVDKEWENWRKVRRGT